MMPSSNDRTKRVFDLIIALPLFMLTLPIQIAAAIAIRVRLGSPVLFRQVRPGLRGELFEIVKFRTMTAVDPTRGFVDDASRMTPSSRWLRATSMDELPTLWNIISGDMSLVKNLKDLGSRIVGSIDDLGRRTEPFSTVLAVGSSVDREYIASLLAHCPVTYPVLVYPQATIGCHVHPSEGVVVAPGSRLSTNIQVGKHAQIDQIAVIGHDCNLGDSSRLNPQACISGAVRSGQRVLIGANAIVLPGLTVGDDDAIVGAGAVVTHAVEEGRTVMGVPAR